MNAHKKVMFVDDEEGVRLSWNRYLSNHGFDVTTAEDGAKAIRKLRREPVDVVVADLKMPNLDGIELLEWIHDSQPATQFILLTGYGNEDVERRVRDLGAFDYLNKPISPDTLAAVVTAASILDLGSEVAEAEPATPLEESEVEVQVTEVAAPQEAHPKGGLRRTLEVVGGLIAAPILGLLFCIFLPVIGFVALFWTVGRSIRDAFRPIAT
ncbi:MAG: response regulator [Gemmatimonadota bacterium]|jgi:DNA-binding NtrC family response regulator